MILIWSGEGGPLQYLGLVIFFLQFFAPQFFHLTLDMHNATVEIGSFPFIWVACSLAMAIFMGGLWVVWDWQLQQDEEDEEDGGRVVDDNHVDANIDAAAANGANMADPTGTAANPIVIDDNDDDDDDDDLFVRVGGRISSLLASFSPTHLMLALGFILPLAMAAPLLLQGLQSQSLAGLLEYSGVIQITVLAIIAHSMMAIAAYRVLRDVLDGEGIGSYPGNRRGGRRRRGVKLTVTEIADIVRKVPVEEFVSEHDVKTGACSISRLKRMLSNRGASELAEQCVERDDLQKEVVRIRNFNEECAICAEEYVEGDILRVTHCQHEFHLHCFDKWIYTFSTDSRPATHPTCPLCKSTIQ
mmetsp:Transcript_13137/g.27894  ORF Transcript_13137/g.27894 Transcript_13137/m.27894 type:complete len:358 (-) Transcript_13137:256-1329(-)